MASSSQWAAAIREGRGGRRSQIFPLNERHDFHHCFCCPGNQGQPSGEYSKRTPCLSLLSDPLPCTPFPDHPWAQAPVQIPHSATTILLVTTAPYLKGRSNFPLSSANLKDRAFLHSGILGVIPPYPPATPGSPKNQEQNPGPASLLPESSGQEGPRGTKGRKPTQPPLRASALWLPFSQPPAHT